MARFKRPLRPRSRRRIEVFRPDTDPAPSRSKLSWWVVAAISLLLVAVPMLLFNQQHSGDRLKIRRELHKF